MAEIRESLERLHASGRGETDAFLTQLRRWAGADPVSAAEWAAGLPAGEHRRTALESVAIQWADEDLPKAAAWALEMPDGAVRNDLLQCISAEAVRTDPVEALRLAAELPECPESDETIRRAAMEWASRDATGAIGWAETISDETLRHTVLAAGFVAWSETEPANAATRALEALPAGRLLEDTLVSIVQRWAQTDARSTAAWVERFPDGPLRAAAVENLLGQWRQSDPDAARNWQPGS